jgi:hypothetical protein
MASRRADITFDNPFPQLLGEEMPIYPLGIERLKDLGSRLGSFRPRVNMRPGRALRVSGFDCCLHGVHPPPHEDHEFSASSFV